jgi:membrane protein YqaA with SNARE-associated domain
MGAPQAQRAVSERKQPAKIPGPLRRGITVAVERTEDRRWVRYAAGASVLLLVVVLSAAVIANIRNGDPDDPTSALLSYLGLALVSFTCCAVPIPGIAPVLYGLVIYCGYALNPLVVAVVGGLAMALGEGVGYVLGALGLRIAEQRSENDTDQAKPAVGVRAFVNRLAGFVDEWMDKRGFVTLVVLAAVPNPIVAFANITAGATGMPFARFFTAVAIGKTIRSLVLAGIGVWLGSVV